MPRQLKPVEVGELRHERAGLTVKLYFDKNSKKFESTVGNEHLQAETLVLLEAATYQAITDSLHLTWTAVIVVSLLRPWGASRHGAFVGLEYERILVAQVPGGEYRQAPWGSTPDARLLHTKPLYWSSESGPFAPPCRLKATYRDSDTYYLPYTDELWAGLEQVNASLKQADSVLRNLISTEDGLAMLASNTHFLLPTGDPVTS